MIFWIKHSTVIELNRRFFNLKALTKLDIKTHFPQNFFILKKSKIRFGWNSVPTKPRRSIYIYIWNQFFFGSRFRNKGIFMFWYTIKNVKIYVTYLWCIEFSIGKSVIKLWNIVFWNNLNKNQMEHETYNNT